MGATWKAGYYRKSDDDYDDDDDDNLDEREGIVKYHPCMIAIVQIIMKELNEVSPSRWQYLSTS